MPSRNTVKQYVAPGYYHIYNRGAGGMQIFRDNTDRKKFLSLLERHLTPPDQYDRDEIDELEQPESYTYYEVETVAYCLMGNHFHLLFYLPNDIAAITGLMRSVSTAYSMYFNLRHKSQGHVFQSVYRAAHIDYEPYLAHISRYIHMNPRTWRTYKWSSILEYTGQRHTKWVHPERVTSMSPQSYFEFLEDYQDRKDTLAIVKRELAS